MQRYFLLCPLCSSRVPLYGDEPDEPVKEIECGRCNTEFLYTDADRIAVPKQPDPRVVRNGQAHRIPPRRFPPHE